MYYLRNTFLGTSAASVSPHFVMETYQQQMHLIQSGDKNDIFLPSIKEQTATHLSVTSKHTYNGVDAVQEGSLI